MQTSLVLARYLPPLLSGGGYRANQYCPTKNADLLQFAVRSAFLFFYNSIRFSILSQDRFHIFFHRGDRCDVIMFHQIVQHIRRYEGWQCWPQFDIFDTQMEQGQ